ncbi:Ctf3p Ecym_5342 [Eremothecium cymbalariae DBVPG|uniref:Centromere protein I n=1 Tax=Eremothecium cymbalariae (strain CBS 270.75 / DBVPG 7215 / KCTC 17166 / NRRL Y-17582) TaxID=931890 RepID=I6NDF9_ERECY|nr:hypothetical protein Ecym_5342 [Eremothecium cymbalariae DBVPG\
MLAETAGTEAIQQLLNSNELSDASELRVVLSHVYAKCPTVGISSNVIPEVIKFLCTSEFIAPSTRVYLIEHCLLPRGYLPTSVVFTVIRYLGVQTSQNQFKTVVPPAIQVALCKWLCHVWLLIPSGKIVFSRTYTLWFQLWMIDYLQDWITYLLAWATTSPLQVTEYRTHALLKIGENPGYLNGRALSAFLLCRYRQLKPIEPVITAIDRLKCNAKRLSTVERIAFDDEFIENLGKILSNEGVISEELFRGLLKSLLDDLKIIGVKETKVGKKFQRSLDNKMFTLEHFSAHIEKIPIPVNYLSTLNGNGYERLLLALMPSEAKDSFQVWVRNTLKQKPNITQLNEITRLVRAVGKLELKLEELIPINEPTAIDALMSLHLLCFISHIDDSTEMLNAVLKFQKMIYSGWNPCMFNFNVGICLLLSCNIKSTRQPLLLAQIFSTFLRTYSSAAILNRHVPIDVSCIIHPLLAALESIPPDTIPSDALPLVFVVPDIINHLMVMNDALLISIVCQNLVVAKDRVKGLLTNNKHVKNLNRCILDMANYLWRNKLFTDPTTWGFTKTFWETVAQNIYLPDPNIKPKQMFTIPNFYPFRYISEKILKDLERSENCQEVYDRPLTDSGFKSWKRYMSTCKGTWLQEVNNYDIFRKQILKGIQKDGTYAGVQLFLQTYLKSFVNENTDT